MSVLAPLSVIIANTRKGFDNVEILYSWMIVLDVNTVLCALILPIKNMPSKIKYISRKNIIPNGNDI